MTVADGSLEALKGLALALMALDHVNKYLLNGSVPALFDAGRMAMPVFALTLAYNLARPGARERGVHVRVMRRLAAAGALATVPFAALGGIGWGWWPLNIMATLLVATIAIYFADSPRGVRRPGVAAVVLLAGGFVVEYWWPALAICVGAWSYFRRPATAPALVLLLGLLALCLINRNPWAFAALPLIVAASRFDAQVPRLKWLFNAAYPLHLGLILLARELG